MLYDCIIVLGGNIARTPEGKYIPSTYQHSDEYGMLGGHMRIIAAAWMYLEGQSDTLIFSTGTSEKTKATLGNDVPTEALVYSQEFKRLVADLREKHPELLHDGEPTIILEERQEHSGQYSRVFCAYKRAWVEESCHHLG